MSKCSFTSLIYAMGKPCVIFFLLGTYSNASHGIKFHEMEKGYFGYSPLSEQPPMASFHPESSS